MRTEKAFIVLLGLLIGLSPLAIDMYLPSMPAISADLQTSPESVQQTLTIFLIAFSLPQLIFGPLSDARGRRFVILGGLLLFIAGSLLCALAGSIGWLLTARGLQAMGASAMAVTVPALVRDRYSHDAFARTMSFIMMVMALAPLVAPMAGGLILTVGGWQLIFWVLAMIALLGLGLFHRYIDESHPPERRTAIRPAALVRNYATLLRDRHAFCHMLCAGFMFAGLMAFVAASPFVYIEFYGVPEQYYGLLFGLNIITMMLVTMIANRFTRRGSRAILFTTFAGISLVSALLITLSLIPQPPLALVVLGAMLFIGSYGTISAHTMAVVMNRFTQISGSASALGGSLRFGTGSLGGAAVGVLHNGTGMPMTAVMATSGLIAVLTFLLAGRGPVVPAATQA